MGVSSLRKSVRQSVLPHLRWLRIPLTLIEGQSASGAALRIAFGGSDADRHYLQGIAFEGEVKQRPLGSHMTWRCESIALQNKCDLVLLRSSEFARRLGFARSWYFIPSWISCETRFDEEAVFVGKSPSRRRDIKQIDKNEFRYEITRDAERLSYFHERMYKPLIQKSHGGAALAMSREYMMEKVSTADAELVEIYQRDESVAGSFILYENGIPRLFSEGVLDGDKRYFRQGVGMAIYLFSFRHLLSRGFDRANVGRSRAFLRDGALYFKRRLGISIVDSTPTGYVLRALSDSSGVKEFLFNNPFVTMESGKLKGVEFRAQGVSVDGTRDDLSLPGLADMKIEYL